MNIMFNEFQWVIACGIFYTLEYIVYKLLFSFGFNTSITNAWKLTKIAALLPMIIFVINFIFLDDETELSQLIFLIQLEYTEGFIIVNASNVIFEALFLRSYFIDELYMNVFNIAILLIPIDDILSFHLTTLVLLQFIPDIVFSVIELITSKIHSQSFDTLPMYNNMSSSSKEIHVISRMNYTGLVIWILFKYVLIGLLLTVHLFANWDLFWGIIYSGPWNFSLGYLLAGILKYCLDIHKSIILYNQFKTIEQKKF